MQGIVRFLALAANGAAPLASPEQIGASSRRARTAALAAVLDRVGAP